MVCDALETSMNTVLAVIPARGGSKSIPRKNIKLLAGKPLIAWTIETARQSQSLSRVIVSTDDDEIAQVAQKWGAEVPFRRPLELATDDSPTWQAVLHAVDWLEGQDNWPVEAVVILQPTSPLRLPSHIDEAINLMEKTGADTVISLTQAEFNPYWMMKLDADCRASWFMGQNPFPRRQDLPIVYRTNGSIEITRPRVLRDHHSTRGKDIRGYVMPPECSTDIDNEIDFLIAETLLRKLRGNQ
jgi:CMP-N-acetylneuraminic acid synthetase